MKLNLSIKTKLFILIFTLLTQPLTAQARDSLAALRADMEATTANLQAQIAALQEGGAAAIQYNIGDTGPAGGIVFFVDFSGAHGLEAAPEDQGEASWGCNGIYIPKAVRHEVGTGAQNTMDILEDCSEIGIAAEIAHNYMLNGFNGWFLPSVDELYLLYLTRSVVGGFGNGRYWSSTGVSDSLTSTIDFVSGDQFLRNKDNHHTNVRAIRAF